MPTASVCIVTYNSAKDIESCLEAVLKQTFPVESIVVIDNASTDGTAERVTRYSKQVQFIANEVNNGFAGGQNQAIRQTRSDYVLVLNPDVTIEPNYLFEIISFMEQDKAVGSATGQLVFSSNKDVMDSAGLGMKRTRNVFDLGAGEPVSNWNSKQAVFGVSGAAAVYRTTMIRDIEFEGEFFDEQFFAYKEDVDVAWRAQTLGWKSYYFPSAKAVHHRGWKKGGRSSIPLFVRQHSYQNRFFTLLKNESIGWHSIVIGPYILATEVIKLGYIVLREPGLLHCWPTILRSFPKMLKKRRWVKTKAKQNKGKSKSI
ncbi:glycosyltransferase family 2 protein [Paenibacillus sp. LHD-38]|uniref:glycosyltransferase family 2 protein n=1 Tax=Paenibacillus sp. LHD-38 TaxID=3072143 RepID=UPI00280CB816|nr:glycosyltransferase family 2 protein [Paenibacillus sp. LHD-38]MDQ8733042.1 glycosyltransferase family 2 protein [Paenibacillus sp. LHD-38]